MTTDQHVYRYKAKASQYSDNTQHTGTRWKLSLAEIGISETPNWATRLHRQTVVSVVEFTTEQPFASHTPDSSSKCMHSMDLSVTKTTIVTSWFALLSVTKNISLSLRQKNNNKK